MGASTDAPRVVPRPRWARLRAIELTVYIITGVRKEPSQDASHTHISEICTQGGIRHTLQEVIDSIRAGHTWKTLRGGHEAEIKPVERCPQPECTASPYITMTSDGTGKDNLESLDQC